MALEDVALTSMDAALTPPARISFTIALMDFFLCRILRFNLYILFWSQYHTTSDALAKIGIEHGPASKVMSRLHEHSVLTFHKILTSRRVLEREKSDKSRQNRPDPP